MTPMTPHPQVLLQLNPAANSAPTPIPPTAAEFPPNFLDTVQLEFEKLLGRDHPDVKIDFNNTWLTQYEYKPRQIPPFTDFPAVRGAQDIRWERTFNQSFTLCESLIDVFLGTLDLEENTVGWFSAADSVSTTHEITSLSQTELQAIYREFVQLLANAYKRVLEDYWSTKDTKGESRQSLFMDECVKALQLEARTGLYQKSLTSQQAAMLEEMLRYSQEGNSAGIKKHGVFGLSFIHDRNQFIPIVGAIVITHANELYPIEIEVGRLGAVVLYTPNDGLEGFDSVQLLTNSLARRMVDTKRKSWLLKNAPQDLASSIESALDKNPSLYSWSFTPLLGHFLGTQFLSQIIKQQIDFLYCVETSRIQGFKYRVFLEKLALSLDPKYQFDNFLNLDWNDRYVLYTSMPNWWQAMSTANQDIWLTSAKSLGNSIIDIHRLTDSYLSNPLTQKQSIADDYIDTTIKKALKDKNIVLTADDIYVTVAYSQHPVPDSYPISAVPADPGLNISRRYSLRSLAAEKATTLKLETAHSINVTSKNGDSIKGMDKAFISNLIEQLGNSATIATFLIGRLKTSDFAKSLQELSTRLSRMQMRMGLLSASTKNIPEPCLQWIKAVIDAPEASAVRLVEDQKIIVRFLAINDVMLSNVAKISPQDGSEHGLVLCTLNAPDGIVFRWYSDISNAKIHFLDNPVFAHYLMLQVPIANRSAALKSLRLDEALASYRFPNFFKNFPSPVPIPGLLWETISFVEQTQDFFVENHQLKIDHLLADSTANLMNGRKNDTEQTNAAKHLSVGIFLLFLPPPVAIPIALGLGLYKAWNGFRAIEENDYLGAAKEFLLALNYLGAAALNKVILASRRPTPLILLARRPQPIARGIGADGDPHIGIVLPPSIPAANVTQAAGALYDARIFKSVEIDDQVFYVRPYANLFGHKKLFSKSMDESPVMIELDEFALLDNEGQWLKAPYQASGISAKIYNQANQKLTRLIADWPATVDQATPAQRQNFEALYLSMANANTNQFPEIEAYCEGGSAPINFALRTGRIDDEATAFMRQFYQLDEFRGEAYRAAYVSTGGLERLRGKKGTIFADRGIQSASVNQANASRWSIDNFVTQFKGPNDHSIFMIFDASIPKKNMFTNFLGDHVGIGPETPLQLMAFKTVDHVNYALFSAPEHIPELYIDTYSGQTTSFP